MLIICPFVILKLGQYDMKTWQMKTVHCCKTPDFSVSGPEAPPALLIFIFYAPAALQTFVSNCTDRELQLEARFMMSVCPLCNSIQAEMHR